MPNKPTARTSRRHPGAKKHNTHHGKKKFRKFAPAPTATLSKTQQLRKQLHTKTEQIGLDQMRELIGMAAKYLFPVAAWNFTGPIVYSERHGRTWESTDTARLVAHGFTGILATQMEAGGSTTEMLRSMARYNPSLKTAATRLRKKRLSRYVREMRQFLRGVNPVGSERGLRYVLISLQHQFIKA